MAAQFLARRCVNKNIVPIDLLDRLRTRVFHRRPIDEVIARWSCGLAGGRNDRCINFGIAFCYCLLPGCAALLGVRNSLFRTGAKLHFVEVLIWAVEGILFPVEPFLAPTEFHDFNFSRSSEGHRSELKS